MYPEYQIARDEQAEAEFNEACAEAFATVMEPVVEAIVGALLPRVGRWVGDTWPVSPHGVLVPRRGRRLYVLARKAYFGNYNDLMRCLKAIGADLTVEEAFRLKKVLSATFEPKKLHKRTPWEIEPPVKAKQFIRRQLQMEKLEAQKAANKRRRIELQVEPEDLVPRDRNGNSRGYWEIDLRERDIERTIFEVFPSRQAEVVLLLAQYYDPERPTANAREVAEDLGLNPRTVRAHRAQAATEDFRRSLGF